MSDLPVLQPDATPSQTQPCLAPRRYACTVHRVSGATLNDEMHILLNGARILPLLLRALLPDALLPDVTQPAFHVAQRNSSLRARPTSRSAECAASTWAS